MTNGPYNQDDEWGSRPDEDWDVLHGNTPEQRGERHQNEVPPSFKPRVFKEGSWWWMLDGHDASNDECTEDVWYFDTWDEAMDSVPEFIQAMSPRTDEGTTS